MSASTESKFHLNKNGEFVIEDYNSAKPFSSFFPGIAGKMGIPIWVFYVNRGQGICSMGLQDKENPIMEFLPANWAYQLAPTQGFRTFLKFPEGAGIQFYEPFQSHYRDRDVDRTQSMRISPSHLQVVEENHTLGLEFKVEYHTVPGDTYGGLIRKLHITNLNNIDVSFEGLDGLPLIIPFGLNNPGLKFMRRLMEAFVEVKNFSEKAPLFKAKVKPADRPDVEILEAGNFFVSFEQGQTGTSILEPIVDPELIFGSQNSYEFPEKFLNTDISSILTHQAIENRLPSAMGLFKKELAAGETYTVCSVFGHIESQAALNTLIPRITTPEYIHSKTRDNVSVIDHLTQKNLVVSSDSTFDMYVRQNFLDNVLRGGYPHTLKGRKTSSVLHLYSRKHGDLERDYNDYRITPSHYSQGNGNFRDINQNRRSDLFFNPDVGSSNLEHFVNLIQLDGFNPLVIKDIRYTTDDSAPVRSILDDHLDPDAADKISQLLESEVTPGEIVAQLRAMGVDFQGNADALLGDLLPVCRKIHDTDFGEGYWSDHWTYNLDLLENFLSIFPEKKKHILCDHEVFTFHDTVYRVLPREDKYVLWDGKRMQLNALEQVAAKTELLDSRKHDHDLVHTDHGKGKVFRTSLLIKYLSTLANKIASLDPSGMGVEMETDKPNWYDALNGIPGLMGSSLSEAIEIKRHAAFLSDFIQTALNGDDTLAVYEELSTFMQGLEPLLKNDLDSYTYWDRATTLKEAYRDETIFGISGSTEPLSFTWIASFLDACVTKIDAGLEKAWNEEGQIPYTYFTHRPSVIELTGKTNSRGFQCFRAKAFERVGLPLFLEGPVHYLRTLPGQDQAARVTNAIKDSGLYDQKLKMYKVNENLNDQPMEIGRARTFSPGWFENESIWLHMEYKYMLEMLRNGLYETFYEDFRNVFIPFLDAEVYGRSILENSSFLVSSANPNPGLHGTGFVARLSGATAEFIHILIEMMLGSQPFFTDDQGQVGFQAKPALPDWLFSKAPGTIELKEGSTRRSVTLPENSFSFMFLGNTLVTYLNPERKNTYGNNAVRPHHWTLNTTSGDSYDHQGSTLESKLAQMIRDHQVSHIQITLK